MLLHDTSRLHQCVVLDLLVVTSSVVNALAKYLKGISLSDILLELKIRQSLQCVFLERNFVKT